MSVYDYIFILIASISMYLYLPLFLKNLSVFIILIFESGSEVIIKQFIII